MQTNWDVHRDESWEAGNTLSYLLIIFLPGKEQAGSTRRVGPGGAACHSKDAHG